MTTLRSFDKGFVIIDAAPISHTSPEWWQECPAADDLAPWMKGFFTRDEVLRQAGTEPEAAADAAERPERSH